MESILFKITETLLSISPVLDLGTITFEVFIIFIISRVDAGQMVLTLFTISSSLLLTSTLTKSQGVPTALHRTICQYVK